MNIHHAVINYFFFKNDNNFLWNFLFFFNFRWFDLCLRLNREESIIAGPSSAMALSGAFKLVADEPGNSVVVIFCDSAFKYASSVVKHLPGLSSGQVKNSGQKDPLLDKMVANVRGNETLNIDVDTAHAQWQDGRSCVIDVRPDDQYREGHIPGAYNMPLRELGEDLTVLPEDLDTPILSVCQRGNASLSGVLVLKSLGYRDVKSIAGGTLAWREKGFDTESD